MQQSPQVNVIIPVHNCARYIEEAILSIKNQTYRTHDITGDITVDITVDVTVNVTVDITVDITVIDDGSEDNSADVAAQVPGLSVLRFPRIGLGAALNHGVRHGSGEFLAFLDADDRWLPDKLAKQVSFLQANPTIDMVFGYVRQFHQSEETCKTIQTPTEIQPGIGISAMLIRRTSFYLVGEFSERHDVHQFMDWYVRSKEANLQQHVLPDLVFERRIHENNMGRRIPAVQHHTYMQTIHASLSRRRTGQPIEDEQQHGN